MPMRELDASGARKRLMKGLQPLVEGLFEQLPNARAEELMERGLGVALILRAGTPLRASFFVHEPAQFVGGAEIPAPHADELEEAALAIVAGTAEGAGQVHGVEGLAGPVLAGIGADPTSRCVVLVDDLRTGSVRCVIYDQDGKGLELGGIEAETVGH